MQKSESQQLLSVREGADLHALAPVGSSHTHHDGYIRRLSACPYCGRSALQDSLYFGMLLRASNKQLYKSFEPLARIGSGSFGTVIKVLHRINEIPLNVYAIKQIPVDFSQQPWLRKILSEVDVLQRLEHPNVIRYYFSWTEEVQTNVNDVARPHLMILLEYAKGGSLANLRRATLGRALSEREFVYLLYQSALALEHLHSLGIISRDVKPENFLLTGALPETQNERFNITRPNSVLEERVIARERDPEQVNRRQQLAYIAEAGIERLTLKAADFGQIGDGVSAGTEILTAPEVFREGKHSKASDVFSLGMSFLQLLEGAPLIENVQLYQTRLTQFFDKTHFSARIKQIVRRTLEAGPQARPTAAELRAMLQTHMFELDSQRNAARPETRLLQMRDYGAPALTAPDLETDVYSNYDEQKGKKPLTCSNHATEASNDESQAALRREKQAMDNQRSIVRAGSKTGKTLLRLVWLILALQLVLLFK